MLKYLNGLLCLQFKRPKWVSGYPTSEWYCGINSFTRHFSVIKKMVEYSLVKVISKDLVKIVAIFRPNKIIIIIIIIIHCDSLLKHELFHRYFSKVLVTF